VEQTVAERKSPLEADFFIYNVLFEKGVSLGSIGN